MVRSAGAQEGERTLHWRSLAVEARLDADGRLHVRERQAMVFSGDWNGGERRFDLRAGQRLRMLGITRIDPATGASRPVPEGDLDEPDRYDREGDTFRWRSRRPDDPPFRGEEIVYELEYEVWPVLLPRGEGEYLLSHDFAFADREGVIESFALRLELDPLWTAPAEFGGRYAAAGLAPGHGYAVRLPLRYAGPGVPATVPTGAPAPVRTGVLLGLVAGLALIAARFLRRERASGRLTPLPAAGDEQWLREQVLRYPPEVVGAAWDRSTGSPEVAALLARLVAEGKLASRVEAEEGKDPVLHLRLVAPREEFTPAERPLIDALFFDGRRETDTETVKQHYKKKGFDPASKIRAGVDEGMEALPGHGRARRSWALPVALLAAGVAVLVAAGVARPGDAAAAGAGVALGLAPALILLGLAGVHSRRVVGLGGTAAGMAILLLLTAGALAVFASGALEAGAEGPALLPFYRPGPLLLPGLALVLLGLAALAAEIARPGDTAERLAFRRRLTAAREMLRAELARPAPRLRDEWYPYLLAFGLGPDVDRWFRAHGGSASASAVPMAAHAAGSASARAPAPFTGGGAAFGGGTGGGGGAGGAWGTAAASMAASVSPPSSGGGGGGAASGGGGGGGW